VICYKCRATVGNLVVLTFINLPVTSWVGQYLDSCLRQSEFEPLYN